MTAPWQPVSETDYHTTDLPRILQPQRPAPLRSLFAIVLVLICGSLLGVASAYLVMERERPLAAVRMGPWEAYPTAGTADADPYSIAIYTRGAVIPLASGEGLALFARTETDGRRLDPACSYRIRGQTPTARLWTLTATDEHGDLMETMAGRTHLTSRQLLRAPDGRFDIIAAADAQPGNWLPLAVSPREGSGLIFTLRLYDAPVTTGAAFDGATMPDIERVTCP
ncbi:MAG: DUF1214 domain-containing protein [Roseibium sp.]|nr:DUF1214 domain-containing protein [Roseibium sp.]